MRAMPALHLARIERLSRLVGGALEIRDETLIARPCSVEAARRVVAAAASERIPLGEGGLVLDRGALRNVGLVDPRAMWIHAGAGARVRDVEQALQRAGLTLGSQPPAVFEGTVAAWLEGPFAGRRAMDGRLESGVAAVQAVLPDGRPLDTRPAPRSAAGPAVAHLILGGGSRCGFLLGATLKARRLPASEERILLEGETEGLLRLLLRALRGHLPPIEACFLGPRRLALRCGAAREDERAALHVLRRCAGQAGIRHGEAGELPPPGGEAWEVEPARLAAVVEGLGPDEPLHLVRMARESCIAVGRCSGEAIAGPGDLLDRICAALRR